MVPSVALAKEGLLTDVSTELWMVHDRRSQKRIRVVGLVGSEGDFAIEHQSAVTDIDAADEIDSGII